MSRDVAMRWMRRFAYWVRFAAHQNELKEELALHRELRASDFERRGLSRDAANAAARRAMGNETYMREEARGVWLSAGVDAALKDWTHALRGLIRARGLSLTVIVMFGLGVGANAAVFTGLDRVFLRPPPGVVDGGGLRRLYPHNYFRAQFGRGPGNNLSVYASARDLFELDAAVRPIARIEGDYLYRRGRLLPARERVIMTYVSPGYFDLLGVHPARGRFFVPDENRFGIPAHVVVISDAFWRTHFSGDSNVLGKTLRILDDETEAQYTVIGVAPPAFEGLELETPDMWVPLATLHIAIDRPSILRLIARPSRGISDRTLATALTQAYRRVHAGEPAVTDSSSIVVASVLAGRGPRVVAGVTAPLIPGMSDRSRDLLLRLGLLSAIVLIIAVANVASLLLMRAMRRRREIAVRLALGISRARLVGQLLIESLVLALVASAVALLTAELAGGALRAQLSSFRWSATVLDARVMTLSLVIAVVGGIIAGTMPALFLVRTDISRALRSGAGTTRLKTRLPTILLVIQAASCTALLACGGAFLESFRHSVTYDRGFESHHLLQVTIPAFGATAEAMTEDIARRLRSMPGVESVGRSVSTLNGMTYQTKVGPNYRDTIGVGPRGPSAEFVDRDFMRAVGFRVVAGRLFTSDDDFQPTTVLTESLAAELFPDGRAIGACVHIREPESPCRTVVGIIRDVRWDVAEPPTYRIYIPLIQAFAKTNPAIIPNTLHVRLRHSVSSEDIRRIHRVSDPLAADRQLTVQAVDTLLEPLARPWRLAATLALLLGLLGLAAATTGIYGLVAFDVAERSREFGIRIALGATSTNILGLVLRSGLRVAAMGVAAGVVAAVLMGTAIASLLFESATWDPRVLAITASTLAFAAVAASIIPAWRAIRGDPVRSLVRE